MPGLEKARTLTAEKHPPSYVVLLVKTSWSRMFDAFMAHWRFQREPPRRAASSATSAVMSCNRCPSFATSDQ